MSRSKKDGRRRGGHRNTQNKELWSRRCPTTNMWDVHDPDAKRITHRYERRVAKRSILADLQSALPSPESSDA